jgi:NAD(P)-dependent dehydrogenase (short-subunit alcohol dehydrogenase family)
MSMQPAVCWITNHPPWLQLQQRHGQLDILYSNAGTSGSSAHAPLAALDLADFDRVMAANTRSKVAGVKHAMCLMVPRRSGCILCTGSTTSMLGGVTVLPYSLSKATVVRLVAKDLAHADVRMNAISPHDIVTPHLVRSLARANPGVGDETLKRMVERGMSKLQGAVLEPEDVARLQSRRLPRVRRGQVRHRP